VRGRWCGAIHHANCTSLIGIFFRVIPGIPNRGPMAIHDGHIVAPNRLLSTLPEDEQARLAPFLEDVELPIRERVCTAGEPSSHVVFPSSAMASTLMELPEGDSVEVGLVGRDGFVGVDLLFGVRTSVSTVIIQIPGRAMRMRADDFDREIVLNNGPAFRLLLRYCRAFLGSVAQFSACNASHALEQRLARWLLMTQDRLQSARLPMTHEFLAYMLAVRRATVTQAANALRLAGLIDYDRGEMIVRRRDELERTSCGCYTIAHDLVESVFASAERR
jgi:CRP-like cAMP-binding protein